MGETCGLPVPVSFYHALIREARTNQAISYEKEGYGSLLLHVQYDELKNIRGGGGPVREEYLAPR